MKLQICFISFFLLILSLSVQGQNYRPRCFLYYEKGETLLEDDQKKLVINYIEKNYIPYKRSEFFITISHPSLQNNIDSNIGLLRAFEVVKLIRQNFESLNKSMIVILDNPIRFESDKKEEIGLEVYIDRINLKYSNPYFDIIKQ